MKNPMKLLPLLLILSISLSQYGYNQWNLREEIISRYDNGNKKLLIKYSGHGSNEIIVERITYSEDNNILMIEKLQEKIEIIMEYYPNGALEFEKHYKEDKLDGLWKSYYESGNIESEGNYKNETMNGEWIFYYENGNIKGKGHYINGDGIEDEWGGMPRHGRDGEWKYYYENGNLEWEANFKDGENIGKSVNYYENGQINLLHHWENGKANGEFLSYYENGNIKSTGHYKNGAEHGEWTEYYENGNPREKNNYKDGVGGGGWTEYYENGGIMASGTMTWGDFEPDDEWSEYYENGNIKSTGHYKNGAEHGKFILYYENGNINEEAIFSDGIIDGEWKYYDEQGLSMLYYDSGPLKSKGDYKNETMNGEWIFYYENENIKGKGHYINGDGSEIGSTGMPRHGRDGEWLTYYESGKFYEKQNWNNGEIADGQGIVYYENGNIESEGNYKNGSEDGLWVLYYEKGSVWQNINYGDKELNGKYIGYFESGEIEWIYYFEDGKRTGTTTRFYENGNIWYEGYYIALENGEAGWNGKRITYYDSGEILGDQDWKNGIKVGVHRGYYKSGSIEWLYYFDENGERDESQKTTHFYENGNILYEGTVITLENGDLVWHGLYKSYDDEGEIIKESTYYYGEEEGTICTYDGQQKGFGIMGFNEENEWICNKYEYIAHEVKPSQYPRYTVEDFVEYPDLAKEAGIEGRVIIAAFINKKGVPKNIYLVKGVFESLDQAALDAVKQSRWIPAKQQDKRIGVWVNIPVKFELE